MQAEVLFGKFGRVAIRVHVCARGSACACGTATYWYVIGLLLPLILAVACTGVSNTAVSRVGGEAVDRITDPLSGV